MTGTVFTLCYLGTLICLTVIIITRIIKGTEKP